MTLIGFFMRNLGSPKLVQAPQNYRMHIHKPIELQTKQLSKLLLVCYTTLQFMLTSYLPILRQEMLANVENKN